MRRRFSAVFHVPLWAQQHMVDRHYSLKPWSARTLYDYAHANLAQILRWSAGNFCLQVVLPGRKLFFSSLDGVKLEALL
jgi:hypothetical protein